MSPGDERHADRTARGQAVYRSLLHLSWIDKLVDNIKTIFVDLYGEQLTKPHTTLVECNKFDEYFDQQMRELETTGPKGDSNISDADFAKEDETLSGNLGDEPPLPSGLHYRGKQLAYIPLFPAGQHKAKYIL